MHLNVCRKRRMGSKCALHKPTFPVHVPRGGKWGPFDTEDSCSLLWSAQAEQHLLVVSLGVFLQDQRRLERLHDERTLPVNRWEVRGRLNDSLTVIVFCKDSPKLVLYSEQIFFRSTSQRDTIILVTIFSLAPLLWADKHKSALTRCTSTSLQPLMQRGARELLPTLDSVFLQHNYTFFLHLFSKREREREKKSHISTRKRTLLELPSWLHSVGWQSTAVCFQSTELEEKENWINIHNNTSCIWQMIFFV